MTEPGQRSPRSHRTWPERLAIGGTILAAVVSFLAAGTLVAAYVVVRNRDVVAITNPAEAAVATTTARAPTGSAPTGSAPTGSAPPGPTTTEVPGVTTPAAPGTTVPETFPPADP